MMIHGLNGGRLGKNNETKALGAMPGSWTNNEQALARRLDQWPLNIITTDLQLYLDAGNKLSYPGTGGLWVDLSGNQNHTRILSPSFTTDAGGGIVMSSTTYCDRPNARNINFANGGFTLSVWLKHTGVVDTSLTQRYLSINSSPVEGPVMRHNASSAASLHGYVYDSSSTFRELDIASQVYSGNYYNFVYTYNGSVFKLYSNNTEVGSLSTAITLPTPSNHFVIGGTGEPLNGNMYIVSYYNRGLTAAEISHNYNTTKARFGLT